MATLFPAVSGGSRVVHPQGGGPAFTLAELQGFVGGYIEALYLDNGEIMFVNEDGLRDALPINDLATRIARTQKRYGDRVVIVGNAIVCTLAEAGGDGRDEA